MDRQRRWLVAAIAAALVVTSVAYLVVSDLDGPDAQVAAEGTTTTAETKAVTTTIATSSTSSTSSTTSATTTPDTTPTTARPSSTTAGPATTTATAPATTRPPAPPFHSSVEPVTVEQLGASWRPDMGCPAPEQLRAVNVSHWGYDGQVHLGRVIVAAGHADRIVAIFREIYAARFPIERMVPVDAYGGDDQASMRANNTSGFNCRYVSGTTKLSQHGLGLAVDVNPLMNPYVKGSTVDPPEGAPYADRSRNDPGMIHAGGPVVEAFAAQGWKWGGYWSSGKDYQHFSSSGG